MEFGGGGCPRKLSHLLLKITLTPSTLRCRPKGELHRGALVLAIVCQLVPQGPQHLLECVLGLLAVGHCKTELPFVPHASIWDNIQPRTQQLSDVRWQPRLNQRMQLPQLRVIGARQVEVNGCVALGWERGARHHILKDGN